MNDVKYIASLDIGAKLTKLAVWVEKTPEGQGEQVFYEILPSKGIFENAVSNKTELKQNIEQMLRSVEAKIGFPVKEVYVSYAGKDRMIDYTAETLCKTYEEGSSDTVVSEKDLRQVEADTRNCKLEKDEMIYDKEPVAYLADGHPITGLHVNTYAHKFACQYNIFAAKEKEVQKLERGLQEANLRVKNLICSMRTTHRFFLTEETLPYGTAVINIGASRIQLGVFLDGHLRHYKTFAGGGDVLTLQLKNALGYAPERAEQIKRNEIDINMTLPLTEEVPASLFCEGDDLPSPLLVVWAEIVERCKEINEQLKEWGVSNLIRNGNGIILTGGGFAFQNIATYIEALFACMGTPVRVIKPVKTDYPLVACTAESAGYDPSILVPTLSMLAFARKKGDFSRYSAPAPVEEALPTSEPEQPQPQDMMQEDTPVEEEPQSGISRFYRNLRDRLNAMMGDTSFDD
ncbi:MAG: hypothetical protein CSA97_00175 [Bacteroidetes bacterium]|nr:MAG: hypothetical protein CSA97_00175 [Bacteroidota bacterium]